MDTARARRASRHRRELRLHGHAGRKAGARPGRRSFRRTGIRDSRFPAATGGRRLNPISARERRNWWLLGAPAPIASTLNTTSTDPAFSNTSVALIVSPLTSGLHEPDQHHVEAAGLQLDLAAGRNFDARGARPHRHDAVRHGHLVQLAGGRRFGRHRDQTFGRRPPILDGEVPAANGRARRRRAGERMAYREIAELVLMGDRGRREADCESGG